MRSLRLRAVPVAIVALAGSALVALQSPAEAAVTITNITSPVDGAHYLINDANKDAPLQVPLTGTSNGTTGDVVDIKCFAIGSHEYQNGPQNVPVQADGSFSATLSTDTPYGTCKLLAVPNSFVDGNSLTGFTGPRITNEYLVTYKVASGPNAGKTYNYVAIHQGANALTDITSATSEGFRDTRLTHPDGFTSNYLWSGVASFGTNLANSRSKIQVDGRNVYGPFSAENIIAGNTPGGPALTYSVTRDGITGVVKIKETNPLVRCPAGAPYPPTAGTCPSFTSAGVRLERSYVVADGGRQVHVTDVWRSTDGKSHSVSAWYDTEVQGYDYQTSSDTDVAFKLPWLGGFQTFTGDATYPGPSKLANSILVRNSNTSVDGDIWLPRGALTFDFPTSVRRTAYDVLSLRASTFTVPAKKSRTLRQSFVMGTTDASVLAKAKANEIRINPYRADAQIKKAGAASYKGNNVYNTTGANQLWSANVKRMKSVTFVIAVQNDGTRTQTFRMKGNGAASGFAVRYLAGASGSTSITSAVVGGTYRLRNIAPGAKKYLRLVVTVKPGTSIGALRAWLVTATPVSDATRKDVVKARVKVVS